MARIPEAELARLKAEVSLERLVTARGIVLKRHGADLVGLCPFHDDHAPSLVVSPRTNLWHCLGACQRGGSVVDWVMQAEGVSFRHAVELLREGLPSLAAEATPRVVKQSTVPKLAAPLTEDADDAALLGQIVDYYHASLKQSPEALAYLARRGLDHPEVITHFKLGFANRTLGLRLPSMNRKAGATLRARLQRLGILRASGHEHFNGSLVVPVLDAAGQVCELYGRKITEHLRPGTPLHLYLPGVHRGVWNVEALAASPEIILCEALIDALTFWCAGYRHVTASYGVGGFTAEHLAALRAHGTARVLIAYDRDAAGEQAATALAAQLGAAGIACYRVQFPKGMDTNAYALKVTPATKSLGLVLRQAVPLAAAPGRPVAANVPPLRESAPRPAEIACSAHAPAALPLAADVLPATPCPPGPPPAPAAEVQAHEVVLPLGERRYRIRGLAKNLGVELLKVNLLVMQNDAFYVDTLDLYAAKQRASYVTHAALELGASEEVLKRELGAVLRHCETLQEEAMTRALAPAAPAGPTLSAAEREAALELLRAPDLIARILADFERCGLVGAQTNTLLGYLAVVSRLLARPLGVVVQSSSAAGKTSLMDAVLGFVPEEARVKYSAMTGQSLFYMGETNLRHKVLAIVEEEGASRASYALKLLQSEGELTIASTGKDPATGNLVTQQYRVEGPVALWLTTTAREFDEELQNRCLVLAVDESRAQTQAIHAVQRARRTLEGLIAQHEQTAVRTLHQNAQRLLRPVAVLNPYASLLTFPDQTTRLRRDHEKYLTLIDTLALLHQYQRAVKEAGREDARFEYLEVTLADIALANTLAHEVLGRSLDELPPQTRRVLGLITEYVNAACAEHRLKPSEQRFTRRQLREALAVGDTQLKVHLARLTELKYLLAHRTRGGGYEYELVYAVGPEATRVHCPGLIEIDALQQAYEAARSGAEASSSGAGRPAGGARSAGGREAAPDETPAPARRSAEAPLASPPAPVQRGHGPVLSYGQAAAS